jgi:hypothetical protein
VEWLIVLLLKKDQNEREDHMKFQMTRRSVPLMLLGVLLLAFGVLLPNLGYYWDDWVFVYFFDSRELGELWDFASYYRPLSVWFYYLTVPLLGDNPLSWQIFALALRWLTAWSLWAVLCKLWPARWRETAWMALIFAVYPTFLQQAIAITYSHHYFSYLLFFVSLWLMVRAVEDSSRFWVWTTLSVVTQALHMSLVEYYVVLEMIRPALLWLLYLKDGAEWKMRARRTARTWAPYLLVLGVYVIWRLFIVQYPEEDPNALAIIGAIQAGGFRAALDYLQMFVRNLLHVLVTGWFNALQPEYIDFRSPSGLLGWFAAGLSGLGLWFLARVRKDEPETTVDQSWVRQAVLVGLLAAVLGLVPGWVTGIDALAGRYGDRVTLAGMFGASVFTVALVVGLVSGKRAQVVLLSLLVGLGVAYQFRVTNQFRWDWEQQQRAYWQIYWRAPGLQEGASLVTDGALTTYANRFSSGMAVNMLYGQVEQRGGVYLFDYFYNGIYSGLDALAAGKPTGFEMRNQAFEFDLASSVFLLGPGDEGECVWFLNERDGYYSELPAEIRAITPYVDLDQIFMEPTAEDYPPRSVFGAEPAHGWCYYFQKADLARQYADWEAVLELERAARQAGVDTLHGYELLPFLEAHLALGDWDRVGALVKEIDNLERDRIRGPVCALWFDYLPADRSDQAFIDAQNTQETLFECSTWER